MCGSVTLLDLCVSALPLCRNRQVLQHPWLKPLIEIWTALSTHWKFLWVLQKRTSKACVHCSANSIQIKDYSWWWWSPRFHRHVPAKITPVKFKCPSSLWSSEIAALQRSMINYSIARSENSSWELLVLELVILILKTCWVSPDSIPELSFFSIDILNGTLNS